MSRTFSTKSGSLESLKVSCRCGCKPKARQMRQTAVCDKPILRAIRRCGSSASHLPAAVSSVLAMTASTCVSLIVRGAPGRGASSSPSSRCSMNLARHFDTVCGVTRCRLATVLLSMPSAPARTMRARCASACAVLRRSVSATSCSRSSSLRTSSAFGRPRIAASSGAHGTRAARTATNSSTNL